MNKINNLTVLSNLNIALLNEMQQQASSTIVNNSTTLLLAPTGSGKTLAYLLPIHELMQESISTIQCVVIVPSRELALQIEQVWKQMGTGFKVTVCVGGHSLDQDLQNLKNPPALLIGTPGRLADHLERKSMEVQTITTLVLDEFDKSLHMGFHAEMSSIIAHLHYVGKKVLLSATDELDLPDFAQVNRPVVLNYLKQEEHQVALTLKKVVSLDKDKIDVLFRLVGSFHSESALIFCNYREVTDRISSLLSERGIPTVSYHGGMEQADRERVLMQFRNSSVRYLVSTDVAARGIDIPDLKHVIHYQLPASEREFIHRNGRTARMHSEGAAYVLVNNDDELPEYLAQSLSVLPTLALEEHYDLPEAPDYVTIYISGGKKNKLNKVDIVGFFLQKGGLEKSDLGLIEIKDFQSFAAVRKHRVAALLLNIQNEKMKGKKYKIEVARLN